VYIHTVKIHAREPIGLKLQNNYVELLSVLREENRALGWRSGKGAALLVGRSRDRFPVVSLDFAVTNSFRPCHGSGVDSAPSENEYQEHFW
jgi:hypothetical protein